MRLLFCIILATLVLLTGCSEGKDATTAASGDISSSGEGPAIQPCKLLTGAQVSSVLPGHDDGMVANAGGSFTKGIDAYQCSYTNRSTGLFTVILNVAQSDKDFSWIKPSAGSHREHQKIDIADGGWVYGGQDDLQVEVVKGRTVIDLRLMDTGARAKSDAMIDLARAVAAKIP